MLHIRHFASSAIAFITLGFSIPNFADEIQIQTLESKTLSAAEIARISEAFGHLMCRNLSTATNNVFNIESIIIGMRNAAAGKEPPMSEDEYESKMAIIQEIALNEMIHANLHDANEFLKKNASEENIIVLESGKLQYCILAEGKGDAVTDQCTPEIHYKGTFLNGTLFGMTEEDEGPVAVPLAQTIPGFSKGIIGMKQGEKRRIYVHPDLGYGISGQMPPNSLLVFEVEVVNVGASPKVVQEEAATLLDQDKKDNDEESA